MRAARFSKPLVLAAFAAAAMGLGTTQPVEAVELVGPFQHGVVIDPDGDAVMMMATIGDILVPPEPTYLLGIALSVGTGEDLAYPANALDP